MNENIIISIASDHAGYDMKDKVVNFLKAKNIEVIDRGPEQNEAVDYPDFAEKVATDISNQTVNMGILICGSGIGVSISANRHSHIRASLCHNANSEKLTRKHNDCKKNRRWTRP